MENVLPELKKGEVLFKPGAEPNWNTLTVIRVGRGKEFDEPVYFLRGMYGVKLKTPYTGEELAIMGYKVKEKGVELAVEVQA